MFRGGSGRAVLRGQRRLRCRPPAPPRARGSKHIPLSNLANRVALHTHSLALALLATLVIIRRSAIAAAMCRQRTRLPLRFAPCLLAVGHARVLLQQEAAQEAPKPVFSRFSAGRDSGRVDVPPVPELNRVTFDGNVLSGAPHVAHWIVSFCPAWWDPCQKIEGPFTGMGVEWQRPLLGSFQPDPSQ